MTVPETQTIYFLRLPEVLKRVGYGEAHLYALIKSGAFPKPIRHGKHNVWPDIEIHAWQHERMAAPR